MGTPRLSAQPHRRRARRRAITAATLLALLGTAAVGIFTDRSAAQTETTTEATIEAAESAPATIAPPPAAEYYGLWVVAPALVTILLAIVTRQVIPSLAVGVLVGGYMLVPLRASDSAFADSHSLIAGLRIAVETYLVGALADVDHVKVIMFTLTIGGMVGMLAANGGTAALVNMVSRWASSPRRGQLAAWFAGMVVFFDDYANTMMVGPTMQPICDRLRISRAKLAYIVDSTAAPVASLALIGTWIGAEVGFIKASLDDVAASAAGTPLFLSEVSGYGAFLMSIPYRFYPILALWLVLIVALLGRDAGPMKRAERRAAESGEEPDKTVAEFESEPPRGRAALAAVPILALVGITLTVLCLSGWAGIPQEEIDNIASQDGLWSRTGLYVQATLNRADPYGSILYGAIGSVLVAVAVSLSAGAASLKTLTDAWLEGVGRMLPAVIILVFAWALSATTQSLQLGEVARSELQAAAFDPRWLPLAIFATAAMVSFATGTSWGTMGILCPIAVTIAAKLGEDLGPENMEQALQLFYASVGAVLAGAIFGDHCSPISDTTVLSSVASGCSVEEHVWTQMPYALLVAVVSMVAGNLLCAVYDQPHWVGLLAGAGALLLIVLLVGRRTNTRLITI